MHLDLRHGTCRRAELRRHPNSLYRLMPRRYGRAFANSAGIATGVVPGRVNACINRCSITPCGQAPLTTQTCDATAQTICSNAFRACNDACVPSTATTAAGITSQAACGTSCCTQFQQCLRARLCDLNAITVINCSENPGAPPHHYPLRGKSPSCRSAILESVQA